MSIKCDVVSRKKEEPFLILRATELNIVFFESKEAASQSTSQPNQKPPKEEEEEEEEEAPWSRLRSQELPNKKIRRIGREFKSLHLFLLEFEIPVK